MSVNQAYKESITETKLTPEQLEAQRLKTIQAQAEKLDHDRWLLNPQTQKSIGKIQTLIRELESESAAKSQNLGVEDKYLRHLLVKIQTLKEIKEIIYG